MTRYHFVHPDARSGVAESGTSMDAMIRPCIRQAFPLPADDHPDDRFRTLLDALAQRGSEPG